MACYICKKETAKDVYLCVEHTRNALEVLFTGNTHGTEYMVIEIPEFKHHCGICGEWEKRQIINYPEWLFLCEPCINEAKVHYQL